MHIQLRERNFDAILIKRFLDSLIHAEIDLPVILRIAPGIKRKNQCTVAVLRQSDKGRGILQHQRKPVGSLQQHCLDAVNIAAVADAEFQIDPPRRL